MTRTAKCVVCNKILVSGKGWLPKWCEAHEKQAKRLLLKAWRAANRERVNATRRAWRKRNLQRQRKYDRDYQAKARARRKVRKAIEKDLKS